MADTVIYEEIYYILPILEALIKGYCFYRLVKPFMVSEAMANGRYASESVEVFAKRKRKGVFFVGVAYFLIMYLLYIIPPRMGVYTAYVIGSLMMFLFICLIDRRNYRQKAFLVMTFFSLNWLSAAMAEILYDNLYGFLGSTNYIKNHQEFLFPLYMGACVFYLTMEFVFTAVGIWQVLRVYRNKSTEMEKKELIMLVLPSLTGAIAYVTIQNYRIRYIVENGTNKEKYDFLMMLFYAISIVAVVVVIVLYQDIRAKQEENRQAELLAVQISGISQHIKQVERLYQDIRSIKHDMANHILTLERLYEGNHIEEAKSYSQELKAELDQVAGGIKSGNPVTDVILLEFKRKAKEREIAFRSEFYYPVDSDINVFDISVILNNALQNAVENTKRGAAKHIFIVSYRRKNAFIIEIRNTFTGNLRWDAESKVPVTSKEKADGHGYGLSNIRRVAEKYFGDIDIKVVDGEFCLWIMLMIERV